jgi:hypothetical protein
MPVLVIDPASHKVHAATFDVVEYWPAAHALHAIAPAAAPLLVIEPAWHGKQNDSPSEPWYSPAWHALHAASFVCSWW